jgi:hypothetical protein
MKKSLILLIVLLVTCFGLVHGASAQSEQIHLSMSRDWGYSSGSGDIQGLFSMKVTGPDNLVRVEFYIDETVIGEVTQAPFKIQFTTDSYPLGVHTLHAKGFLLDGTELDSQVVRVNFVSAQDGWQSATKIIIPMAVILVGAIILAILVPVITTRGKLAVLPLGEERKYGINGGGICPKCKRPFVMHLWGLNLGLSRYDRCPYCGKWSVVRIQPLAKLREAEIAELSWSVTQSLQTTDEEKLRKELDDSKYSQ